MIVPDFVIRLRTERKGLLAGSHWWKSYSSRFKRKQLELEAKEYLKEALMIIRKKTKYSEYLLRMKQKRKMAKKTGSVNDKKVRLNKRKKKVQSTKQYKDWRNSILNKFNHACSFCGAKEKLELDHIEPVSKKPELVMTDTNARILCKPCHQTTDSYPKSLRSVPRQE